MQVCSFILFWQINRSCYHWEEEKKTNRAEAVALLQITKTLKYLYYATLE